MFYTTKHIMVGHTPRKLMTSVLSLMSDGL